MQESLYIHYDTISHQILVRGLPLHQLLLQQPDLIPQKVVLLQKTANIGRIDPYTKFSILDTEQATMDFFTKISTHQMEPISWIDYQSKELLQQLTPQEIAELLYLNHTWQPLRSPFFYKLQNNWTLLVLAPDCYKIFQRDLTAFYRLFCRFIEDYVSQAFKPRLPWQEQPTIHSMSEDNLNTLKDLFREGVWIGLNEGEKTKTTYRIPLRISEGDAEDPLERQLFEQKTKMYLTYDFNTSDWTMEEVST
ncbi:hypothetical protein [Atopobacter phocae]|uniref:hypothetical protein n=1 Tax=Atopobacter phocae TaxID=136492 RepID=UPI00047190A4|nr:hypothetical protein [Atopobacter phocae]